MTLTLNVVKVFPCPYAQKHDCDQTFASQEEASKHGIKDHPVVVLHRTEDGLFYCFYMKEFGKTGCLLTFTTHKAAREHLDTFHKGEADPIPCPLSSECHQKTYSHTGIVRHVEKIHRDKKNAFKCEWLGCDAILNEKRSLDRHVQVVHKREGRVKCSHCEKDFGTKHEAEQHEESVHNGGRYPCPYSDCEKKYSTIGTARAHARAVHEGKKFSCPFDDCDSEFADSSYISVHIRLVHKNQYLSCPVDNCDKVFFDQTSVKNHIKLLHHGKQVPCPGADKYDCREVFRGEEEAQLHLGLQHAYRGPVCPICGQVFACYDSRKVHEKSHTHPFPCPRIYCEMRLKTPDEALAHSTGENHATDKKLYQCTVPNCRLAVVGIVLPESEVQKHWQGHVDREHVSPDAKLVYQPVEPRPLRRITLFDIIYQFGIDLATGSDEDSNDQTEPTETDDFDYQEPSKLDLEEDYGKDFAGMDLDQLFSEEHCASILAQNTKYFGM